MEHNTDLKFAVEFDGETAVVRTLTEGGDMHLSIVEEVKPGSAFYTISYEQLLAAGEGTFTIVEGKQVRLP